MKRFVLILGVLFFASSTMAAEEIYCKSIYSGTLAASATDYGETLETQRKSGYEGYFSIQPVFTGTGVLQISYQISNDGATWSPAVQIVASATSGTHYPYPADGVNIFSGWQRLVFTETGTSNEVVIVGAHRCAQ